MTIIRSPKTVVHRSRPLFEIRLIGDYKAARLRVGDTVELAPHADLWMRGAKTARIKWLDLEHETASVEPFVAGAPQRGKHVIPFSHIA